MPASFSIPPPSLTQARLEAREAGLRYVSDHTAGYTRKRSGGNFRYFTPEGKPLRAVRELARIRSLVIPPAWTDVWICPLANGHLQATGRDERGRKQYPYHAEWRATRDGSKFTRILAFGRSLPRIRRRVARDLRRPGLGREKVLAAMVRLLETTLIRIGNEAYAKQNHSFGLSTMRDRHVAVTGTTLRFAFRGKSGKHHEIDLHDARLARIVKRTQELPGQELFQYLDHSGARHTVTSTDVNDYLHTIAGDEFSAKDFRTWAGTVLAAVALREFQRFDSYAQAKRNLVAAIESVARKLGNTPAICRKCYVHPVVMESYLVGETIYTLKARAEKTLRSGIAGLSAEEGAVLAFLQRRLARPGRLSPHKPA